MSVKMRYSSFEDARKRFEESGLDGVVSINWKMVSLPLVPYMIRSNLFLQDDLSEVIILNDDVKKQKGIYSVLILAKSFNSDLLSKSQYKDKFKWAKDFFNPNNHYKDSYKSGTALKFFSSTKDALNSIRKYSSITH